MASCSGMRAAIDLHPLLLGERLADCAAARPASVSTISSMFLGSLMSGPADALRSSGRARLLELAICVQSVGHLAEVDLVAVEFGAVDAGVFGLAVDRDAAAAAHPRAVDHDRVERDRRLDRERARQLRAGPHHRHRADGEDLVDAAGLAQLLERLGHEAVPAVAAVVRADDHVAAGLAALPRR
jgi:hypothetical protein